MYVISWISTTETGGTYLLFMSATPRQHFLPTEFSFLSFLLFNAASFEFVHVGESVREIVIIQWKLREPTHVLRKFPARELSRKLRMFISSFPCNGFSAKVAVYLDVVSRQSETRGVQPGPNEDESWWELTLMRVFVNSHRLSSTRAKREKTLIDSHKNFEHVQSRWECMRVTYQTRVRIWTLINSHPRLARAVQKNLSTFKVDENAWEYMRVPCHARVRVWTLINWHPRCLSQGF